MLFITTSDLFKALFIVNLEEKTIYNNNKRLKSKQENDVAVEKKAQ